MKTAKPMIKLSYLVISTRILLLITFAIIIWACFNKIPTPLYFSRSDNILHFTGFVGLGALTAISFPYLSKLKVIAAIISFGIALELAQPLFTANRELSFSDMISNASGGIVGYVIGMVFIAIAIKILNRPLILARS